MYLSDDEGREWDIIIFHQEHMIISTNHYVIWLIKQEIKKSDGVGSMHQPGDPNPKSKHALKDEQHFNLPQDLSGS